ADPGFDASVRSEFRTRLIQGGAAHLLLEPLLRRLEECDLLKARGTQRTDSTHILAAIRTLNRLELVGETMRYALNRLASAAPAWLRAHMQPAWGERYSHRVENYRFPKADADRQQLATTIGADGFALLQAAYASEAPPEVRDAPAVEVLRQIWVQQYYGGSHPPRWRHEPDVPPAAQLIHSPYDLDARYSLQHGSAWVGYKAHVTETCDDDTPHVITHVETTPATTPDDNMLEPIHAALAEQALLPREHLVDCGYTDAETLVESAQDYGVHIVGPVAADPSWQAREGTGYDQSAFTIDWHAHTATCPHGKRNRKGQPKSAVPKKNAQGLLCVQPARARKLHPGPSPSARKPIMKHSTRRATTRRLLPSRRGMRCGPALKAHCHRGAGPLISGGRAIWAWRKPISSTF